MGTFRVITKHEDSPFAFAINASTKEEMVKKLSEALGKVEFVDTNGVDMFKFFERKSYGNIEVIAWVKEEDRGIHLWISKFRPLRVY